MHLLSGTLPVWGAGKQRQKKEKVISVLRKQRFTLPGDSVWGQIMPDSKSRDARRLFLLIAILFILPPHLPLPRSAQFHDVHSASHKHEAPHRAVFDTTGRRDDHQS